MEEVEYPINGILDLHQFHPRDLKSLVPEYLALCREKKIYSVRIVHGKGIGVQREMVHKILERIPWVISYNLSGSWGATIAVLSPEEP